VGDTTSLVPGFPIRTSSDPRSVDSSPRHNAASHVLHRLPVPRHPPCALKHLHTKQNLGKTRKNCITKQKDHHGLPVRCSQPLSTNQTPHPTTKAGRQPTPYPRFPTTGRRDSGLVVSKPNSVSGNLITGEIPHRLTVCRAPEPHPLQAWPIQRLRSDHRTPTRCGRA
jgi:hypothetical protein